VASWIKNAGKAGSYNFPTDTATFPQRIWVLKNLVLSLSLKTGGFQLSIWQF